MTGMAGAVKLHQSQGIDLEYEDLLRRLEELEKKEKELSRKLRINEAMHFNILNALPVKIFLEDREGRTIFGNKEVLEAHGMTLDELKGKTVFDFFPKHIAEINRQDDLGVWESRKLLSKEGPAGFKGEERTLYTAKTIIQSENEEYLLGFGLDITDRVRAEQKLRESEEKFRNVVDQAADSIFLLGLGGEIINVNSSATELLGFAQEKLLGMNAKVLFGTLPEKVKELYSSSQNDAAQFEDVVAGKDGSEIPVDISIRLISIGDSKMFLALCRDIRDRKKSEEAIQHMAYHDALTGLPNRWFIESYLNSFYLQTAPGKLGVLLLDLDHFKVINDSLGHHAGDLLLKEVAVRLRSVCGQGNIVARFGGDEFIVLLPDLDSKEETIIASEKIITIMEQPFYINGQKLMVTTSIGISISPYDGDDINILIKNADLAMYKSKEQGRNCYRLYNASMNAKAMQRIDKEIKLRQALENGEFILHYQPKMDIKTDKIIGMEALIRWNRDGKIVYPDEFIGVAEETGLIVPIGEWVIREACRQCKEWHDSGLEDLSVSVNLSPRQFEKQDIEVLIEEILIETGLPPYALELELTEGTVMKDPMKTATVLGNLKSLGISIAIDDFGTGFSSLNYLKNFSLDILKIDKSFILNLDSDHANASIAAAVITLAHSLNLRVVAEGVETGGTLDFLGSKSCDFAQGYFISKPLDAKSADAFMKNYCLLV